MTAGKYLDDLFFVGPLLHRVFRKVLEAQRLINRILNTFWYTVSNTSGGSFGQTL
jgi:hypothetical protein